MRIFALALSLLLTAEPVLAVSRARPAAPRAVPMVAPYALIPAVPSIPQNLSAGLPSLPALPSGLSAPGPKDYRAQPPELPAARPQRAGLVSTLARYSGVSAVAEFVAYPFTIPLWADQIFDGRLPLEKRVEAAEKLGRSERPEAMELLGLAATLPEMPVARAAERALARVATKHPRRLGPAALRLKLHEQRGAPSAQALRDARAPLYQSALKRVIAVSAVFLAIEAIGGQMTGSLSLKADAMHMAADLSISVGALVASWIARRPGSDRSWLQRNAEPLVGLLSARAIGGMAVHMGFEAYERLWSPAAIPGLATIGLAFAGLASNVFATIQLYRYREESLSVKGAFLHAALDAVGSVGIIVAGSLIWAFGWSLADPIASFLIVALVLRAVWGLGKSSLLVLLGKAPQAPH